jgi:hypothetical protein
VALGPGGQIPPEKQPVFSLLSPLSSLLSPLSSLLSPLSSLLSPLSTILFLVLFSYLIISLSKPELSLGADITINNDSGYKDKVTLSLISADLTPISGKVEVAYGNNYTFQGVDPNR